MQVDLYEEDTLVKSTLRVVPNPDRGYVAEPLKLNGRSKFLTLTSVTVNGSEVLGSQGVELTDEFLIIDAKVLFGDAAPSDSVPADMAAIVACSVKQRPQDNTALDGLYKSSGNYCTQMEAEGFRNFAYHMDRPDVQ